MRVAHNVEVKKCINEATLEYIKTNEYKATLAELQEKLELECKAKVEVEQTLLRLEA
ncbi:hypothetical protein C1H46_014122 [Malus baccata]|uniref:Uncharacterized protein n=1 Tax=Malus baccata TaxID=106549 RepID=A0A540MPH6_MALBA|nr:hypothetical protein C1H46_014122 [Malus baccata]